MIKIENIDVWGFDHAIRGMRNPLNSWDKSDSICGINCDECTVLNGCSECKVLNGVGNIIGENDLNLMRRLYKGGTEHRKYLRQIFVSLDITAPLYWWKEFDTYKVGIVANSCSTMHKISDHKFTYDDFSCEHLNEEGKLCLNCTIENLNWYREKYLESKDKSDWWQMIQLLPTSFNQKRTVTMNYENIMTIIKQRFGHKLDEWNAMIGVFKGLPYIEDIMGD